VEFGHLLKGIIETVHRYGLQARYLRKHSKQPASYSVDRFNQTGFQLAGRSV